MLAAIRDGSVDAIVLNKDGKPALYSTESADYVYRILIEKFGEGAVTITDSGLILYCNDYFAGMLGTLPEKIIGTYFDSFIDSVGQFQGLKTALKTGASKGEITLNVNGKKLSVYMSLTDLKPMVPAIAVIIRDLSERKKREGDSALYQRELEARIDELTHQHSRLLRYIHTISSDLQAPVNKIVAHSGKRCRLNQRQRFRTTRTSKDYS